MNSNTIVSAAFTALASIAFGAATDVPTVSDVTYTQSGGRAVTVSYTLADAPAIVTMDVLTNGVSIGADKVTHLEGDINKVVQTGTHQFKWFARRDWPEQKIPSGVQIQLKAWALTEPPLYMVADLETKSNVTYYVSVDALPDGGLSNRLYKTSRLVMRRINAAGVRWNMGSHSTEIGYQNNQSLYVTREKIHPAQLTNDYYIGIYPLTRGQFKRIAGFAPSRSDGPSGITNEIYSVQWVSYSEMRQVEPTDSTATPTASNHDYDWPASPAPDSYLGKISSFTGVAFDLPGEGEWEYACRAGNYSGYWGDGSLILQSTGQDVNLSRLANYALENNNQGTCQPVGIYEPNAWGLYDMHGNLWEMCLDIYVDDISELNGAINTTQIASQSLDGTSGIRHADRGGARHKQAWSCRSSFRDRDPEAGRSGGVGFRLVSRIAQ